MYRYVSIFICRCFWHPSLLPSPCFLLYFRRGLTFSSQRLKKNSLRPRQRKAHSVRTISKSTPFSPFPRNTRDRFSHSLKNTLYPLPPHVLRYLRYNIPFNRTGTGSYDCYLKFVVVNSIELQIYFFIVSNQYLIIIVAKLYKSGLF